MAIAARRQDYLARQGISFEVVEHSHTGSSTETAQAVHIPGDQVAKAVMVEDEAGYVMVVIPSTHRLQLGRLHKALGRELGLATESELTPLFQDCERGAIPPVGEAYGIATVVDNALMKQLDLYLEAGDHEQLIHLSGDQFRTLMRNAAKGIVQQTCVSAHKGPISAPRHYRRWRKSRGALISRCRPRGSKWAALRPTGQGELKEAYRVASDSDYQPAVTELK